MGASTNSLKVPPTEGVPRLSNSVSGLYYHDLAIAVPRRAPRTLSRQEVEKVELSDGLALPCLAQLETTRDGLSELPTKCRSTSRQRRQRGIYQSECFRLTSKTAQPSSCTARAAERKSERHRDSDEAHGCAGGCSAWTWWVEWCSVSGPFHSDTRACSTGANNSYSMIVCR